VTYKCKTFPYPIGSKRPDKVLPAADEFIAEWLSESPPEQRPCVEVKCFGKTDQVFIEPAFRHIREKRHLPDVARRLRFLPCVKELLEQTTDTPVTTNSGSFMLEGKAGTGERFRAILGLDKEGYSLISFYPID
jgi:hypothetical protein